jgi:L-ribulokinase
MNDGYLVGLDYGTESARGVLLSVNTGSVVASHSHPYRNGVMTRALPNGVRLPPEWALQNASDYTEAAEVILRALAAGKDVVAIGLGFTASSPLPARFDGTALSVVYPEEPHAYVKLWKHHAAQRWADRINANGGAFLKDFGGKVSSEWLLPKAWQIADEGPNIWTATDRFIEAGDWLVWQLTGQEARSYGFATYKAQYRPHFGYPSDVVPGLTGKLNEPIPIGRPAGVLTQLWRNRCGLIGEAVVAVAIIDSHVIMPAVGAIEAGAFVGALGTSAAYLLLDDQARSLPIGIEGVTRDGVLPGLWCYEAGQAGFGDTLAWFVRTFPRAAAMEENFALYNAAAAELRPGDSGLLALDWWNGCRVPFGDSSLSGLLLGLNLNTQAIDIYRALLESLCYGARSIVDHLAAGGAPLNRILLSSGLSQNNPLLMQLMADVLGRDVAVPQIQHATAIGAAIHGAVAAGVVADYAAGARRFGARDFAHYVPASASTSLYDELYEQYRALSSDRLIRGCMHVLGT